MLFLILLFYSEALAQQEDTLSKIDEIEIITKYKPILVETEKIYVLPEISNNPIDLPVMQYDLPDLLPTIGNNYSPIRPVSLKKEKPPILFGNFAKLGFGNYSSPYAQLYLHSLESRKYSYGINLLHHSAKGPKSGELKNVQVSQNDFNLFGERFLRKGVLSANFNYNRQGFTRYGYPTDAADLGMKELSNVFHLGSGNIFFSSIDERKKNGFLLGTSFSSFGNDVCSELDFMIDGGVKWSGRNFQFDWNSKVDLTNFSKDTQTFNRTFVHTFPKISFRKKYFEIALGARATLLSGDDSLAENLYITPYAFSKYKIAPELFIFGELDGGLVKNSFQNLARTNPFINNHFTLTNTFNAFHLKVGASGNLHNFSYSGNLFLGLQNNRVMFATDSSKFRAFDVLYDNLTQSGFQAQMGYTFNQKGFVNAKLTLTDYKTEKYTAAFHLPNTQFEMQARYYWNEKFIVKSNGLFLSERLNRNEKDRQKTNQIPAFFDLSFGLEYLHKKTLTFFLEANNVLNKKYQFWANHPRFGLNVLGGVSLSI